jgi:hypothetical protein
MSNQILQLEADKAKLQYELEGLQDELKDTRQKHKDECLLGEALQVVRRLRAPPTLR